MHTVLYPRESKPMNSLPSASVEASSSRVALSRRTVLKAAALAPLLGPAAAVVAQPAAYPSHALKMVIPFPAGGPTDVFARAVSAKVSERLGQTVVVDNKPGAGGAIGSDFVARAPADGYTILLGTSSTHSVAPAFGMKLPYDTVKDFTPIVHVGDAPNLMLVPNDTPARDVKEWIAYARKNGYAYRIVEPNERVVRPKAYSDNFRYDRISPWTH